MVSDADVEIVREIYAALHGDDLDADYQRLFAPSFEARTPESHREAEIYRGREGVARWIESLGEIWSDWRWELEDVVPTPGGVLVSARLVARGKASGSVLERKVGHLWQLRRGRATGMRIYSRRTEAREAAGLLAASD